MDTPLSKSNVSLKLAEIQKRCAELMEGEGDDLSELTLEEPLEATDEQDQYCIER